MLSARCFYFICYGLFYGTCYLYPNNISKAIGKNELFFIVTFLGIHVVSIYLFLTAGKNPGFVDETETVLSRREKAKLFVGYDEFKTVTDEVTTIDYESQTDHCKKTVNNKNSHDSNNIN